jgi:hypothetical protein
MLDHEVTCLSCGNLPAVEKTDAAISKSDSKGKGIVAKLELSDMQADAKQTIRKIQTKFKINLKILALILAIAIAIPSGYFGYTAYTGPNYQGKTIEEVFKGREDQINAVLEPSCSVATNEIASIDSEITNMTEAIAANYQSALGFGVSAPAAGDVRKKIKDEVENQLKASLGDEYLKLGNKTEVLSSGEESAVKYCQIEASIDALREKSRALGQTITAIQSPGSWASSDYYYDDEDPNMPNALRGFSPTQDSSAPMRIGPCEGVLNPYEELPLTLTFCPKQPNQAKGFKARGDLSLHNAVDFELSAMVSCIETDQHKQKRKKIRKLLTNSHDEKC